MPEPRPHKHTQKKPTHTSHQKMVEAKLKPTFFSGRLESFPLAGLCWGSGALNSVRPWWWRGSWSGRDGCVWVCVCMGGGLGTRWFDKRAGGLGKLFAHLKTCLSGSFSIAYHYTTWMWAVTQKKKSCSAAARSQAPSPLGRFTQLISYSVLVLYLLLHHTFTSLAWFCLSSEVMSNNVWILKVTLKGSTLVKRFW